MHHVEESSTSTAAEPSAETTQESSPMPEDSPSSEHSSQSAHNTDTSRPDRERHMLDGLIHRLRAHAARLRIAKARAEFETTLLTLLTLNVIYMYYIDHKLLVFLIRASQLIRLVYFPDTVQISQRGTAILLLLSNLPVLLIHKAIFTGPNIAANIGQMLFINFIGPEPKGLAKVLFIDCITVALQALLLQCKWDSFAIRIMSALPVPSEQSLIPLEDDPDAVASIENQQDSSQTQPVDAT